MKTYTIKEIKEQGIWVKCTGQSAAKLLKAMGAFPAANGQEHDYYKYDKTECWLQRFYKFTDQTPSSYIEFIQIDWEDRKQIGWELKKDCKQYREAALKICGLDNFVVHNNNGFFTISKEEEILRKAGVLELWFEPVYEEVKFKVKDKVITNTYHKDYNGKVLTINFINENGYCKFDEAEEPSHNFHTRNIKRHATTEEIKAAEKIEIGGVAVEICSGYISINGMEYNKTELEYLLKLFCKGQVKSLNVGCSGQYKVEKETIERILSKLK